MSKNNYLIGEPNFLVDPSVISQVNVAAGKESLRLHSEIACKLMQAGLDSLSQTLKDEYHAILDLLILAGVNPFIAVSKRRNPSTTSFVLGMRQIGISSIIFDGKHLPYLISYPRDMFMVLPDGKIICNQIMEVDDQFLGCDSISSSFGEGGRLLISGDLSLVHNRTTNKDGIPRWVTESDLSPLRDSGLKVKTLPEFCFVSLNLKNRDNSSSISLSANDHIDRTCALVRSPAGKAYLLISQDAQYAVPAGGTEEKMQFDVAPIAQNRKVFEEILSPLDIELVLIPELEIPYALNFEQLDDSRVLMTSGASSVENVLTDLGIEFLTTEIPIRAFPLFFRAGLRCMITPLPDTLIDPTSYTDSDEEFRMRFEEMFIG